MEEADILVTVEGPTPWASPIVITQKPQQPEKVHVCVDVRLANIAIRQERHLTPTVDSMVADVYGTQWFSKVDLKAGYRQLLVGPLVPIYNHLFNTSKTVLIQATEFWDIERCGGIPEYHYGGAVRSGGCDKCE